METHHLHIYLKNSRCKANFHQRETPEKKRNCGSPACLQLFGRCDHLFRNRMPVINHSNPPPNDRDQPTYSTCVNASITCGSGTWQSSQSSKAQVFRKIECLYYTSPDAALLIQSNIMIPFIYVSIIVYHIIQYSTVPSSYIVLMYV